MFNPKLKMEAKNNLASEIQEIREQDIKVLVKRIIDNDFDYYAISVEDNARRDEEIAPYVTQEVLETLQRARPIESAVRSKSYSELNIEELTINYDKADLVASLRAKSYPRDEKMDYADSIYTYNMSVGYEGGILKVLYYAPVVETLYADYFKRPEETDNTNRMYKTTLYIENNIKNLKHITYMFQGTPEEDPLESDEPVGVDSYNILYWLFKKAGIETDYPLNIGYFLIDDTFEVIFPKGHKYKHNIEKFDAGDILFFDTNDTMVGVYMGEGKFASLIGTFPADDTPLKIYKLDDYWGRFNGRVARYKGEF